MNKKISFLSLVAISSLAVSCGGASSVSNNSSSSSEQTSSSSSHADPVEDNKVHLIILTGQSGARGKALVSDLSDEQKAENTDVDIIADGLTMPELTKIPSAISNVDIGPVKPGYGDSATEFGPELGIGETLKTRYPKDGDSRKSVIVKYTACGSTFTDHWYSKSALADDTISSKLNVTQMHTDKNGDSQGPLTDNLYQLIDSCINKLTAEGYESVIDGCIFTHGEQDAKYDDNMDIYEKALKYFISDLRSYVGNDKLPFVVTEALTKSAKYSNKLREIEKQVTLDVANTSFVDTSDLYTNTFEPWHFGAASNYVLGSRAACELISLNDNRKITSIPGITVNETKDQEPIFPQYLNAEFSNGTEGLVKVTYPASYDKATLGEQEISVKATTNWGDFEGKLKVNVTDEPTVDGALNEYADYKANSSADGKYKVYVKKGVNGLYFAADITDTDLWTDGEAWGTGDMGQNKNNDDFRIYATTTGDVMDRYTLALSSAGLLRIYDSGTTFSDNGLQSKNLIYKKYITSAQYHVQTKGIVNNEGKNTSQGMTMELYVSYDDLGIDNTDNLKLCFDYNNVASVSGTKSNTDNYLVKTGGSDETNINSYFSLAEII